MNIHGIYHVYTWYIHGIYSDNMHIEGIYMVYTWYIHGIYMVYTIKSTYTSYMFRIYNV